MSEGGTSVNISSVEPIISCENLTVAYGNEVVLHNVSLHIPRGAFIAFVGPNGAGKTTLLRTILGLLKPRGGRIVTPFHRSPPGYVPQQKTIDPLYPVSVRQIVMMGLYQELGWWRIPTKKEYKTVDSILEKFGLLEHSRKRYSELSGGMKQKVLIARALASHAEVFVMDEPTSELDEDSEKEVISDMHRLSCEEGHTVLLAVHNLDHVQKFASLVCLVNHGRVRLAKVEELTSSIMEDK